ncbi:21810_t:CDS:2 [Gigaspora margarita]|uniref:21810_t:CDS:1 n=1 Tax=Gigaspora margarita TaxID=4874 RepID=A0ABN7URG8_GIGMA|nr:21810_t:CDS:2 [Gigaspora margarita]
MPSHVALLVAVMSVKSNPFFLYGLAKYKVLNDISQTIRWKYFFPTNKQPQLFTPSNLVFISGKYVIEKLEQCITISYASITNNENPNREFDISDIPVCIPHCMISVTVNRKPKEIGDYIHFGVESVEYNSVTGSSAVKMQMTVLYSSQATRFQKYLGASGSNIKTSTLNYNTFKNSSLINSSYRSIIDIVANDIESISARMPLKHAESSASSDRWGNISAFKSAETLVDAGVKIGSCSKEKGKKLHDQPDYIELDDQDDKQDEPDFEDEDGLDDDAQIEDEEHEEDLQPKK